MVAPTAKVRVAPLSRARTRGPVVGAHVYGRGGGGDPARSVRCDRRGQVGRPVRGLGAITSAVSETLRLSSPSAPPEVIRRRRWWCRRLT